MKRKWMFIYFNPIAWFLVIWLLSLGKCEFLTLIYGNKFTDWKYYESRTMIENIDYIKILDYTNNYARIYCVSNNNRVAHTLEFIKVNFEWEYVGWANTIWSTSGTADNTIWPYWWHFFYSHPRLK
jgi:hypothetical protein